MEQIIIYGDSAQEWLSYALESMEERTGWRFPKSIQEWLFDYISEVGYVLNESFRDTLWCWDNAYINGVWGEIAERDWSDEEARELLEEGNLLFYDSKSGYYVERL